MGAPWTQSGAAFSAGRSLGRWGGKVFLVLLLPCAAGLLAGAWGLAYRHQPRIDQYDPLDPVCNPAHDPKLKDLWASTTVHCGYLGASWRFICYDQVPGIDLTALLAAQPTQQSALSPFAPRLPPLPMIAVPDWSRISPEEVRAAQGLEVVEFVAGVPLPVLYGAYVLDNFNPPSRGLSSVLALSEEGTNEPVFLPTRVLWPGLLASIALVDGSLSVLACVVVAIGRGRRRRRGLCAMCGYDLAGLVPARCPECGEVIPVCTREVAAQAGAKIDKARKREVLGR